MEESKQIKLPIGDVSLEPTLGNYYIDMRPAKIHYSQNIYGGKFDSKGVPMIISEDKPHYFPINIAQYGFILHAEYLENKNKNTLNTLNNCIQILESLKKEYKDTFVWWHNHYEVKYQISPPWASAMAQGEVISLYLRVYQLTKNKNLLESAIKAYDFLKIPIEENGVRRYDEYGNLWFEEYPSEQPSLVLNGFIYTLFGLYDLYRIIKRDDILEDIKHCEKTLANRLSDFDAGYWSYYDLQKKELVRYYYQKNVHVPQMEVLYLLTNEKVFRFYKNKWEKQLTSINYIFVQIMYRVKYRIPLIFKVLNKLWKK